MPWPCLRLAPDLVLPLKILLIKCIVVAICLILKDISEVLEVEEFSTCAPACNSLRGSFRATAGSPACNTLRGSIRDCGRFPSIPSMKCSEGPVSEAKDIAIFISRLKWKVSLFTTQLELVLEKPKVYSYSENKSIKFFSDADGLTHSCQMPRMLIDVRTWTHKTRVQFFNGVTLKSLAGKGSAAPDALTLDFATDHKAVIALPQSHTTGPIMPESMHLY